MSSAASLADLFSHTSNIYGNNIALEFEGRHFSYKDLDNQTNNLAHYFTSLGVKAGDRVSFLDKNSDLYIMALGALAKIGAVCVPINYRLMLPEVSYILKDSDSKFLLLGQDYLMLKDFLDDDLKHLTCLAFCKNDRDVPAIEEQLTNETAAPVDYTPAPEDAYLQMYTSGTTGHPKGVLLTNQVLKDTLDIVDNTFVMFDQTMVQLSAMPFYHIAGMNTLLIALHSGAKSVITREVNPVEILKIIPEKNITIAFFAPVIIQFLLMTPGIEDTDFSCLENIYYGGSPIAPSVLTEAEKVFNCNFYQVYGMTETMGLTTILMPEDHKKAGKLLKSCGKPFTGITVRIEDADGNEVGINDIGEVKVLTKSCMAGYWNKPEATAKTIDKNGWLSTGDAGYRDEEGYIFIHDRMKDMIISGAENIYPAEVEKCLISHHEIADAGVFGIPDDRWGEVVCAAVSLQPNSAADEKSIIKYCREKIAHYKCPTKVVIMKELPRNASGKVLRRELRAPYWKDKDRNVS